ncbi:MAG: hypothetical protein AABZ47_04110 [Planctomycetota bacterium]
MNQAHRIHSNRSAYRRRRAYVLLETVIATGLLLVGLAVIGTQLQEANTTVGKMDLRMRAIMLADMQLAELDLGLVELDSVDEVQEEDFGLRFPEWAWRLTIEETSVEKMFLLRLDVLHAKREDYSEEFDFEGADRVHTVYAMRPTPEPLDLITDFGLTEKQATDLDKKLSAIGEGFDISSFDPALLAKLPFDQLVEVLPSLLDAFNIPVDNLIRSLPPDVRKALEEAGLLGGDDEESAEGEQGADGGQGNQNESGQGGAGEQPQPEEEDDGAQE